ncbi:MAG: lysophospholipid acyltransferase family protein [Candidatus Kapabacteria bacterium]|nr:lysophospholipid acyltransferase family protein [Candidatus Kapabacteria bacterium]
MIAASPQGWAHTIFRRYLRSLVKKRFHALHVLGDVPKVSSDTPVLLLPNHSTWWDGFFPYVLNDIVLKREFFIMMLEHRLREFWFFRFVGAFSINQQSPKGIAQSLDYTASLLQGNRLVVLFPQGELAAWGKRPLGYNRGVERVIRKSIEQGKRLAVIPLAMRCEFLANEKPHVFLLCGAPIITDAATPRSTADELERLETALLEELESRITAGDVGEILL